MIEPIKLSNTDSTRCSTFILKRDSMEFYWLVGLTKLKETDDRTMVAKALRFWRSCDANVSITCHNDGHAACKSTLFSPVTEARSGWKKAPRWYCCIDRNSTWDWVVSALYPIPCGLLFSSANRKLEWVLPWGYQRRFFYRLLSTVSQKNMNVWDTFRIAAKTGKTRLRGQDPVFLRVSRIFLSRLTSSRKHTPRLVASMNARTGYRHPIRCFRYWKGGCGAYHHQYKYLDPSISKREGWSEYPPGAP